MQLCANCGFDNREGLVFCERCGVALSAVSVSTKKLNEPDDTYSAGGGVLSQDNIVLLHFDGYDDPLAVQIDSSIILGRSAGEGSTSLNLEAFKASDHGVSRQHAALIRDGNQLFIRDLGSTNYTYLNGERLAQERDYSLRDGDTLQLGRLGVKIFFK